MEVILKYVNPLGKAAVFKTQRLPNGTHPPYVLNYITGVGGPQVDYESIPLTGNDGSSFGPPRYSSRIVQTGCMVYGATDQQRDISLRELNAILNPALGDGTLVYQNHEGEYQAVARCRALPEFGANTKQQYWKPVLIDYECSFPFWKGKGAYSAVVASSDRSFKLPFKLKFYLGNQKYLATLNNMTSVWAPVKIVINGPAVNPSITNLTTQETFRVRKSIAAGEILTVETGPKPSATIRRAGGVAVDAMNYVNLITSKWVKLAPGVNEFTYASDDGSKTTRIEIHWNDWFLGVG